LSSGHDLASRTPEARYVSWAVVGSAVLHGAILAIFVVMTYLEPPKLDIAQKPVSARLVRLGQRRDEHLLPRISSPPPPTASSAPQPVAIHVRDHSPSAPSAPAAPHHTAEQNRRDLFSAFSHAAAPKKEEPAVGEPDGDPNGDSDTAEEGDRYFGLILAKARRNYGVTKTIPPQELIRLKATVILYINNTGELIKDPEVQISSGNEQFDQDVILSLKKAAPFGPPPTQWVDTLRTLGVAIVATP
jgi:outer membrane biosynthesis protein TonB